MEKDSHTLYLFTNPFSHYDNVSEAIPSLPGSPAGSLLMVKEGKKDIYYRLMEREPCE